MLLYDSLQILGTWKLLVLAVNMKKIDFSKLQPGDILLTTSHSMESWSVRFGTKSDISHAMLYVASSSVVDSTSDGVHARNLQKIFFEDDCAIQAFRLITPPSPEQIQTVIAYARSVTGTPYALREAVWSASKPQGKGSKKQFCSRLVARAYASAGIKLVDNPDFCTPQQLKESCLLQHLPSPTVEISKEEISSITSQPNRSTGMIEVTNEFLNQVRRFAPDVLEINDVFEFLFENPTFDSQLYDALKSSGYLDFWQEEYKEFYWRYDFEDMNRLASDLNLQDHITDYCRRTYLDFQSGTFQHWEDNLIYWKKYVDRAPLMSFKAMATLYENLVESSRKRYSVANQWLMMRL